MQGRAVQYIAVQCSAVHYRAVYCSSVQYRPYHHHLVNSAKSFPLFMSEYWLYSLPHTTVMYIQFKFVHAVHYYITQYWIVQNCISLYSTVQYCNEQYFPVQFCTLQCNIVISNLVLSSYFDSSLGPWTVPHELTKNWSQLKSSYWIHWHRWGCTYWHRWSCTYRHR